MFVYPHRIRLRAPWECEEARRRIDVPFRLGDLGLGEFRGTLRLRRPFGYPGRIDADERVWLTFGEIRGVASITLNRTPIAAGVAGPFEFDVTQLLKPHNQLEVSLEATGPEDGLIGEVAMEVRRTAYLKKVTLNRGEDGRLQVRGDVQGECDGPLELYVLVDNRNAGYQTVSPGQTFTIPLDQSGRVVRVELVNVSLLWYFVELQSADAH